MLLRRPGPRRTAGPVEGLNAFAAGALLVIVATALLPGLIYGLVSPRLPSVQPYLPGLAGAAQLLAFAGDGVLAGLLLGVGLPRALFFGAGLIATGFLTQLAVFSLRFFPAFRHPVEAIALAALLLGAGFGLAGAACGLASRLAPAAVLRSCLGFAAGGAIGGTLLTLPLWIPEAALAGGWDRVAAGITTPVAFLVPHLVGGALLGADLQNLQDRDGGCPPGGPTWGSLT